MANITHFEIPADDMARARDFYRDLFGWEFGEMSLGGSPYFTIKTGGGIGGGLLGRQHPQHAWTNYVSVDSLSDSLEKAVSLGGEVVLDKTAAAGTGWFALFKDTENNVVGLWQDDQDAK